MPVELCAKKKDGLDAQFISRAPDYAHASAIIVEEGEDQSKMIGEYVGADHGSILFPHVVVPTPPPPISSLLL